MPKTKFVKDIQEGEQVRDLFLVSSKAVLSSNSGKPYINLSLRDRTGQVECRVWDRAEEIAKRFDRDYIGGLLEHTVSVAAICRLLSGHYEGVDADLLIAGALLHDIGKVGELSYEGAFDYTDEGRLLGHLYMGAEWVAGECARIEGFPADKTMLVKHMILSHHGELEYGSPKRPKTLEAILLHFVENMDSKANAFLEAMEDLREGATWTDYQRMFERCLFAGKKSR